MLLYSGLFSCCVFPVDLTAAFIVLAVMVGLVLFVIIMIIFCVIR